MTNTDRISLFSLREWALLEGDCVTVLAGLDEASVDAVVCDPPYGLGFMGKEWDSPGGTGDFPMRRTDATNTVNTGASRQGGRQRSCDDFTLRQARDARTYQAWCEAWAAECLRVLKPGGHLLAFGGTRTYHRLAAGIEDAGFEMRDTVFWLYGQGFPKSRNTCTCTGPPTPGVTDRHGWTLCTRCGGQIGLGTALKPACEPITLARKSPVGSVAANVTSHGTGALNIQGCRIDGQPRPTGTKNPEASGGSGHSLTGSDGARQIAYNANLPDGRWPANVVLDEEAAAMLDEQTGDRPGMPLTTERRGTSPKGYGIGVAPDDASMSPGYGDSGGASRFFYCAKPSQSERNAGLDGFPLDKSADDGYGSIQTPTLDRATSRENWQPHKSANIHPTVKPVALMRWLERLVTPPGGIVVDPFAGSGTSGIAARLEGFRFVGVEQDADYLRLAEARIAFWEEHGDEALQIVASREAADRTREEVAASGQLGLLGEAAA